MQAEMQIISWWALAWCFVPLLLVAVVYWRWFGDITEVVVASVRMVLQLVLVGYVLVIIFAEPSIAVSLAVMLVMFVVASWISIRPVRQHANVIKPAAIAILLSVAVHLAISVVLVLRVETWFEPRVLIPLAGMYFANTMTSISLTAERYFSEFESHGDQQEAKKHAFKTAMIPQINGLLAVGLVALPGMMTGQILSGVSPLIAVRYQIMIMAMILGTAGVGSVLFLWQLGRGSLDNKLDQAQ